MFLSVIIPCRDEAGNLDFLLDEIVAAMSGRDYEILIVDDGSGDNTEAVVRKKAVSIPSLRLLRHTRPAGKGAALRTGVFVARGEMILTIDGDGQNNPVYLPQLAEALIRAGPGCGIAAAQRQQRTDSVVKQQASRFANGLRRLILHDNTDDTACGLKAIHTHIFRRLPFFDNWHRYFPALVLREGFGITHIDVIDRERRHGSSKYGILDRGIAGISDLLGVWWLRRRCRHVPEVVATDPDTAS